MEKDADVARFVIEFVHGVVVADLADGVSGDRVKIDFGSCGYFAEHPQAIARA